MLRCRLSSRKLCTVDMGFREFFACYCYKFMCRSRWHSVILCSEQASGFKFKLVLWSLTDLENTRVGFTKASVICNIDGKYSQITTKVPLARHFLKASCFLLLHSSCSCFLVALWFSLTLKRRCTRTATEMGFLFGSRESYAYSRGLHVCHGKPGATVLNPGAQLNGFCWAI